MDAKLLEEENVVQQLARLQDVRRRRRKSHAMNKRARGHKSPNEKARSNLWYLKNLPFHRVDAVDLFELEHQSHSLPLQRFSSGTDETDTSHATFRRSIFPDTSSFCSDGVGDGDFDDTDWFAGNEWCEGAF
ncbi:2b [Cucumber mosaic virus]|uniref:2b n=1 Tax=Cucumber mosaic virus TaxID=12305 RepID=A0A140H4X1_9BROM|nr:2b [Cucumber mosaic virus]